MGLVDTDSRRGGARRQFLTPPLRLLAFLTVIAILGLGAIVLAAVSTPWSEFGAEIQLWPTLVLSFAAVSGELKPIRLPRVNWEGRTLSTSAPFVLALIAFAGVGPAVVVQAIASVADDVLNRRDLKKSLFNSSQYALSVLAAGAVYSVLAKATLFGSPSAVETRDIVPLLVAGVAMIGVNWLLVASVVSIATSQTLMSVIRQDPQDFIATNVVLLSVGGIAAVIARDGVGALLLLAAPVIASHVFAAAAGRHAHDAAHDALTGLGNRGNLHLQLGHAIESAHRMNSGGPGLVVLDLDHFKDINDTLGHPVGDQILKQVANRLVAAAPQGSSAHRLGGDEYAVIVHGDLAETRRVARTLLASLESPVPVDNLDLLVRCSVGVAVAPEHGTDSEELMKNADIALYHAKLERDRISIYSADFDVNSVERLKLLADLRAALDSRALHVVYQPQVDLATGRMVGLEALVRWVHPHRGPINTEDFIVLAENSGLIYPLTAFVLDTALGQLASWRASGHDLRMAVNLSARHLSDLGLPDQVAAAAKLHGVPLSALVLEVTETGIMSDPMRADIVIRTLRGLGVEISIDDYGTGNASLSYLRRLEIDELKVDRSFVSNLRRDDHDRIIVRSTIELALALGLRVVAEGIEDEPTASALSELGAVIGQGYHLGRPQLPEDIEASWIEQRRAARLRRLAKD